MFAAIIRAMSYYETIRAQTTKMGLRWPEDIILFPVGQNDDGTAVFYAHSAPLTRSMFATGNKNPICLQPIPLSSIGSYLESFIGYIFPDGEIRWDTEMMMDNGFDGKPVTILPVHIIMYSYNYPHHLRQHLAAEKAKRSVDKNAIVLATH